jgi:hypothetical protein
VDLARLRFGDWVLGLGGVAVLVVMFLDWYAVPEEVLLYPGEAQFNAWEAFAVNDVILALAAVMAIATFVLTATQPTAAVPIAIASLTTLVGIVAFILVTIRVIWPPDVFPETVPFDTARETGAWIGLVASAALVGGGLVSIRDERVPRPEHPVEPRLVQP